jgi:hypothetical protein
VFLGKLICGRVSFDGTEHCKKWSMVDLSHYQNTVRETTCELLDGETCYYANFSGFVLFHYSGAILLGAVESSHLITGSGYQSHLIGDEPCTLVTVQNMLYCSVGLGSRKKIVPSEINW